MNVLEKIESGAYNNKLRHRDDPQAYARETAKLLLDFQRDLEVEFGLVGHPNAGLLFNKALEISYNYGMGEVRDTYGYLADLEK